MGEAILGVAFALAAIAAGFLYIRGNTRPPPAVPVEADDAELIQARRAAQASISEFRALFYEHPAGAVAKVPVKASSGILEWMFGEVLELTDVFVKVQFQSKPQTHRGAFDAIQSFPLRDIADWIIIMPGNRRRGGFTQRVHFARLRAAGQLHGAAAEEASKYD